MRQGCEWKFERVSQRTMELLHVHFIHLVAFLLGSVCPSCAWNDTTGFYLLYTSNEAIMRSIPVQFNPALPDWVNGTIVHNGPGMFEVNGRKLGHLFDGFAKPIEWRFDGHGHARFTTDFLKTESYRDSMNMRDVAPYILYMPPSPPFSWMSKMRQMANGLDNVNINVARIKGQYMFISDIWKFYMANPGKWYVKQVYPSVPESFGMLQRFALSSSHPLPDDSKKPDGAHINFYALPMIGGGHTVHLCKILSPTKREFFGEVSLGNLPYMHCFGATKEFVILFGHPLYVDPYQMLLTQAAAQAFVWKPKDGSKVYIVHKRTGKVYTFSTGAFTVTHHVNAYETEGGKIVADFVTYPDPIPFAMFKMNIIKNQTARDNLAISKARIRRFIFDLNLNVVKQIRTPNFDSLANRLEMPIINEKFRFRPYCYVYGLTMSSDEKNFADFRLVKRDMCTGNDTWWGRPGFYPSEPRFIARPGATEEDDGFVFSTILNGREKVSYLAVHDAKTMREISYSYLPTFVPFLLHGQYFSST